jgi:putative transposase
MKRSRFTEAQTFAVLREQGAGFRPPRCAASTGSARRGSTVGRLSLAGWRCPAKRLRQLECENAKLKRPQAEAMLDNAALKDFMTKNSDARRQARGCRSSRIRLRDKRAPGVPPERPIARRSAIDRVDSWAEKGIDASPAECP